jgi:AraC-like DNA-binding protein
VPHGVTLELAETSLGAIELFTFEGHRHALPRHAHDVLTLGAFGVGNGTIRVRGGNHRALPGTLLALAPNEVHSAEPLRGTGWTYRSLCPSATLLAQALDGRVGGFAFSRPVIADAALAREVSMLHGTLSRRAATLETEVRVIELLRRAVGRHGVRTSHEFSRGGATDLAIRARELMEARLASPLLLADVARECGVSPFQLIRAFHAAFGVPPHAYLMQARLRRARAMLCNGEGISKTAFACGFVDQSHLTRVFKRYYGMTPGAYTYSFR